MGLGLKMFENHWYIPDFLLGVLKGLSNKVNRLELCDWIFLEAGLLRVKGEDRGLVCQAILENTET